MSLMEEMVPFPELPRYMAILSRAFRVLQMPELYRDEAGRYFCHELADALHNLPELIALHCEPEAVQRYGTFDPERFWNTYVTSMRRRQRGRYANLCDFVFDEALPISVVRTTDDFPPTAEFKRYQWLLYRGLVYARNFAMRDNARLPPVFVGWLAPLPDELMRWSQFDEVAFWATAEPVRQYLGEPFWQYFIAFEEPLYGRQAGENREVRNE